MTALESFWELASAINVEHIQQLLAVLLVVHSWKLDSSRFPTFTHVSTPALPTAAGNGAKI